MSSLYREWRVWRRIDAEHAVMYACLERLNDRLFGVQSADFHKLPPSDAIMGAHARQFVELFIELDPGDRCAWHESLEEAIACHDREFGNPY